MIAKIVALSLLVLVLPQVEATAAPASSLKSEWRRPAELLSKPQVDTWLALNTPTETDFAGARVGDAIQWYEAYLRSRGDFAGIHVDGSVSAQGIDLDDPTYWSNVGHPMSAARAIAFMLEPLRLTFAVEDDGLVVVKYAAVAKLPAVPTSAYLTTLKKLYATQDVHFIDNEAGDVIAWIKLAFDLPLLTRREKLADAGIFLDERVTLRMRHVNGFRLLDTVLTNLGVGYEIEPAEGFVVLRPLNGR